MRLPLFILVSVGSISFFGETASADAVQDRAAVIESMLAWEGAVESRNYEELEKFYAEDAIYYPNDALPIVGRQGIIDRNRLRGSESIVDITQQVDDVQVHHDWATYTCLARIRVSRPDGGAASERHARVLLVMKKGLDGQWRIFRDIDNTTPERLRPE
ncbi:MAG: DUF4440 domain-containing protein [Woeseia sp.]